MAQSEVDAYLIRLVPNESALLTIPNPITFTGAITVTASVTHTGTETHTGDVVFDGNVTFNNDIDLGASANVILEETVEYEKGFIISGEDDSNSRGLDISGVCVTPISITGAFTTGIHIAANGTTAISITGTNTNDIATGGKCQFGGPSDYGAGVTGHLIDGSGWDTVLCTVGRVEDGSLGAACAAAYYCFTVNTASHTGNSSYFGTWTELYLIADCILTGNANCAAIWGQVEALGAFTAPDSGDFVAAGYFNLISGGLVTLTTGSHVSGIRIKGEVHSITGSGIFAAISINAATTDWAHGLYIENCTTGITIPTGPTLGLDIQARSRIGTHNWGADSGIVPSATGGVLEVAATVATDITGGAYASAFNIMAVTSSTTGDVSIFGAWHELYITGDLTFASSNHAATWSMINLSDAGGALTFNAAGTQPTALATWLAGHTIVFKASDGVELGAGCLAAGLFIQGEFGDFPTIDGDAKLCGILVTVQSKSAAYMPPWPVGLEIADSAATIGILVGNHESNAILVTCSTGTTGLIDIYVDSIYTLATVSTTHECARFAMTYTPGAGSGTSGQANLTVSMNYLNIDADLDGTNYISCLSGLLYFTTDGEINCGSGIVTALKAELCVRSGGVVTSGNICLLHLNCNTVVDINPGGGNVSTYIFCDGDAATAGSGVQDVMTLHTKGNTDHFLRMGISYTSGMLTLDATGDNWTHKLAVNIDGGTYYIKISDQ